MEDTTRKMIFCTSCGAEFDINLSECPYCGTMNYVAAEAEYLAKLEDVKEDLDDLQEVPMEEMKREMKNQWDFVRKIIIRAGSVILLIALVIAFFSFREQKREEKIANRTMQWLNENEETFDQLYYEQRFDEMRELYLDAMDDEELSLYQWKYFWFIKMYDDLRSCEEMISMENSGEEFREYDYCTIFNIEWNFYYADSYHWKEMTPEQAAVLSEMKEPLIKDFETRWKLTDKQIKECIDLTKEGYGTLPYNKAEKIVQDWMKKQED